MFLDLAPKYNTKKGNWYTGFQKLKTFYSVKNPVKKIETNNNKNKL